MTVHAQRYNMRPMENSERLRIRNAYATGEISIRALAKRFSRSQEQIAQAVADIPIREGIRRATGNMDPVTEKEARKIRAAHAQGTGVGKLCRAFHRSSRTIHKILGAPGKGASDGARSAAAPRD